LRKLVKAKFFDRYLDGLLRALGHKVPFTALRGRILPTIFVVFCIYSTFFYSVNKTLNLAVLMSNSTATASYTQFAKFGTYCAHAADILSMLLSSFVSGIAFTLYLLTFSALHNEYAQFHDEVMKAIDNGQISIHENGNALDERHSHLIRLTRMCNLEMRELLGISFVFGLFANVSISFVSGSFASSLSSLDQINVYNWTILSLLLVVLSLKKPYDLHYKIEDTKDHLAMERSLWLDTEQNYHVKRMVERVTNVGYYSIRPILFNVIFIGEFAFVVIWVGLKVVN
jgi:hypothetical protein